MKNKAPKIISILAILVAFSIWLYKVVNYVEVDQQNDRTLISNAVVDILNDLQSEMESTHSVYAQFLRLDEMDESQRRGTWALFELFDPSTQKHTDPARSQLNHLFSDKELQDKALLAPALKVVDSYSGYEGIFKEVHEAINSKKLSNTELEKLLAESRYQMSELSDPAINEFEDIRYKYIKGE